MDGTRRYVKFSEAHPCKLVWLMVVIAAVCAPFMMKLSSTAVDNFAASPGTRSYAETELIKTEFPGLFNDIETLYMHCASPCDVIGAGQHVFAELAEKLSGDATLVKLTSWFSLNGTDVDALKVGYVNVTANSMQASLEFDSSKGDNAVNVAVTKVLEVTTDHGVHGLDVYLTGPTASRLLGTKEAGKKIGMADGTGMIFIVILFGWQVRSWRLTLIPIFNTVLCLFITEALIYPLSSNGIITLPSYVSNVCLFLSIALSVDYSFFHLSRFQEVRRLNPEMPLADAVEAMVRNAGRVVLVSGIVLLFCWLALAAFPVFGTNTLGYCSAITIFVCISVNLIMNPAMIFALPNFFGNASQDACRCCRCCKTRNRASVETAAPLSGSSQPIDFSKNCYGRVARAIVKMPCMIIVPLLVYALLLPGAIRLFTADLVVGGISGGTPATEYATKQILKDFPSSQSGIPLSVILKAPAGETIQTEKFFSEACQMARLMSQEINIPLTDFKSASLRPDGSCLTWRDAEAALAVPYYRYFAEKSISEANTSVAFAVSLPYDAFSNEAKDLTVQGRKAIDEFEESKYGAAAIFHPMVVEVDAEEVVQSRFVWVVAITLLVVFSVIALRYRAALIPVKLFFTIALPIISVLGAGVFVFEDGVLNWTGIPSMKSQGGLVWINPVACTFMLIGFALDYDIFLFSRIYADRREGRFLDDREAIVHAVGATGPVITTAGVIMALAFSGMVLQSTNPFLCQMGFTMISGILIDTFIVRTLLVPAFLSMAGRYNWWPGKMPSKDEEEDARAGSIEAATGA